MSILGACLDILDDLTWYDSDNDSSRGDWFPYSRVPPEITDRAGALGDRGEFVFRTRDEAGASM